MSIGIVMLVSTLTIAAWTDWKEHRIYNKILAPSLVAAMIIHLSKGGLNGFILSFLGLTFGFMLLILPYFLGGLGAGDVKLLAVIGAYGGPLFVFDAFLYTAIIGGFIAIENLILKKSLKETVINMWLTAPILKFKVEAVVKEDQEGFPYGIPIALGTLIALVTNGIGI